MILPAIYITFKTCILLCKQCLERDGVESDKSSERFQSLGLSYKRRIRTDPGGHREDRVRPEQECRIPNGNY